MEFDREKDALALDHEGGGMQPVFISSSNFRNYSSGEEINAYGSFSSTNNPMQNSNTGDNCMTKAKLAMSLPLWNKPLPNIGSTRREIHRHSNPVVEASIHRSRDEQEMQTTLRDLQLLFRVYNSEIDLYCHPGVEYDPCRCPIHDFLDKRASRSRVQKMWSKAVIYPGEKLSDNPYRRRRIRPYYNVGLHLPHAHARWLLRITIVNDLLNEEAQAHVNTKEPKFNIWDRDALDAVTGQTSIVTDNLDNRTKRHYAIEKESNERPGGSMASGTSLVEKQAKPSKFSEFKKSMGIKSSEEQQFQKTIDDSRKLRDEILREEQGRWPDENSRYIVAVYQEKTNTTKKISNLRAHFPIQYLHLLRAGYFEPIPAAWASLSSSPLTFSIKALPGWQESSGWRGITPAWRNYQNTAEERLYWVLNQQEGSMREELKPDLISTFKIARNRLATTVEPPSEYFSPNDTNQVECRSVGYTKQVVQETFQAYKPPRLHKDDTIILLDVSESMTSDPLRAVYDEYLITGFSNANQPKHKDVAKAIIHRFISAVANHDHRFRGSDFITFSEQSDYVGTINCDNFHAMWSKLPLDRRELFCSYKRPGKGDDTRVMTGWQKVKEIHFQKHSKWSTYDPTYGWQASPEMPTPRILLVFDGKAADIEVFELELLGLSWAYITIFLIGVEGCPNHHRRANELQKISNANPHVSFVDAQGGISERFVTHELLKRHFGREISMQEFMSIEGRSSYRSRCQVQGTIG